MDSFEQARQRFMDGLACLGRNDLEGAEAHFTGSLQHLPDRPSTLANRAAVRLRLGRLDAAQADAARAVEVDPGHVEAWLNLALVALERDDAHAAAGHLQSLLRLDPGHLQGWLLSARLHDRQGRPADAADCYRRALEIRPGEFAALMNLGAVLNDLGRFEEALEQHDRALAVAPSDLEVLSNRAVALAGLARYEEALAAFEHCVSVDPARGEGWTGRAMALVSLGRADEALACLEQAHRAQPSFAPAWSLHAAMMAERDRHDEAMRMLEQAVALAPDNAQDRLSLSHLYLAQFDFARGWPAYEARLARAGADRPPSSRPRWDGSPTPLRLFAWAEQGIGDQVLCSTMFPDLLARAPSTTVSVDAKLLPLLRRSFPGLAFTARSEPVPDAAHDLQVPVGSLGGLLRPSLAAFAGRPARVLVPDAARVRAVRSHAPLRDRRLCGLSWSSSNGVVGGDKSLPLERMRDVLMLDGFVFVNLQYGDVSGEVARACALTDAPIETVPGIDLFDDIDGLAALVEACDVVLTTSNSTAHLAGALGRPTLLLVPRFAGRMWYWNVPPGQVHPPWYPSVHVLRQDRQGDWSGPLREAKALLEAMR